MQKRHTRGPWKWLPSLHGPFLATAYAHRRVVLDCARSGMRGAEVRFANLAPGSGAPMIGAEAWGADLFTHPDAVLIEAAPEMLDALEFLVEVVGYSVLSPDWSRQHRDEIESALSLGLSAIKRALQGRLQ